MILPQCYRTGPGHDLAGIALHPTSFLCLSRRWARGGQTWGASDIVKAESSGEDPRATGGLRDLIFLTLGLIKQSSTQGTTENRTRMSVATPALSGLATVMWEPSRTRVVNGHVKYKPV